MGVKYLNKYLVTNCKNDIVLTHMCECKNKILVVDISIYMYKFQMSDSLIDNMYIMLNLFEKYDIIPVFIFDGKPPPEKRKMIDKLYLDRINAETEYNDLCKKVNDNNISAEDKRMLTNELNLLKRKCVYISKHDIEKVQELIYAYGYSYCVAPSEADELCATFVKCGYAWACVSEDMDMFVYGVPRVLRYLSLINNTFVLYDTHSILNTLSITQNELRYLCILSGTDYDIENDNNINNVFDLFYKYKYSKCKIELYDWLKNKEEVKLPEKDIIKDIYDMFCKTSSKCEVIVKNYKQDNNVKNTDKIKKILEEDGFIYPN